jgi:hypothetical protein
MHAIPKVLASDAFRGPLRQIPMYERIEATAFRWFESLSPERREAIRTRIKGPEVIPSPQIGSEKGRLSPDDHILAMQGRRVVHSCQKAERILGYAAPVRYAEAMELTAAWLRFAQLI